jgi:hypothetical protein
VERAMHMGMLCETFHCLPSQLLDEDSYSVWLLTVYLEARQEAEQKAQEEQARKQGKTPRR